MQFICCLDAQEFGLKTEAEDLVAQRGVSWTRRAVLEGRVGQTWDMFGANI